jgi:hypothetical protein
LLLPVRKAERKLVRGQIGAATTLLRQITTIATATQALTK